MKLTLVFRIFGGLNMLTGAGALFATNAMLGSAGMTVTPQLITVGQAFGVAAIALGLVSWRMVDIAGESLSAYGQLFGIVQLLQIALIVYHLVTGQAGGPPVYINLVVGGVLAALFFMQSANSDSGE
jgi:hypothetical protein|tara:strand:+ start:28 stop:408 length:381 start_codon:yes stop_codon:yes gene_type:complete